MTPAWMLQGLLAAALLGLGALAAERVAGWFGVPLRSIWAAAMLGSLLLPALSLWAPGLVPDPGILPAAAAPLPTLHAGALPPMGGAPPAPIGGAAADAPACWADPAVLLGLGWLAASLAVLGIVAWTYRRLRRACAGGARVELDGGEVRVTERVGPAVVGLVDPEVVVPRWVLEAPAEERRLILLHEREHVAAGDAWLLFLGTLAVAAMPWSVPLWWQHRRLRAAVEADCDARVLARGASRRAYGQVLIRTAGSTSGLPLLGPAWGDSTSQLERRIVTMTAKRPSHPLLRSLPLVALAAAVATTACDVAAGAEAEASLTADPPSASASLRVGVAAGAAAGERGPLTDTLPPLPPLAPAAPAPPPPPDSTPPPPPPPDAPPPPAPPAPDRSDPPGLVAPPAPATRPAQPARPAPAAPAPGPRPVAPAAPSGPVLIVTETMAIKPDPSRPEPTARLGWAPAMPVRLTGSPGGVRMLDYPKVAELKTGGGAWRAGVRSGDEVLALNGMDARELRSLAVLTHEQPGTRYAVRIRRGGVERELTAELDPLR